MSQAAFNRLACALALSVTLHVFVIYGLALRPAADSGPRRSVINVRLALADPIPLPVPAAAAPVALPVHTESLPRPVPSLPAPTPVDSPAAVVEPMPTEKVRLEPDAPHLILPDPVYYPAKELEVYPQPFGRITPAYPETARASQISGWVTLLVLIDEGGRVTEVSVVDAAPEGVFEESAVQALPAVAFSPAQKDGRAARSRILIKIEYDPAEDTAQR